MRQIKEKHKMLRTDARARTQTDGQLENTFCGGGGINKVMKITYANILEF